ncbi:hypothetical protein OH799_25295 [Nocardia sp. NBC_00881]|nr:hypothetical protein OH799_25295 [Nocardia sp. NBC_00881]
MRYAFDGDRIAAIDNTTRKTGGGKWKQTSRP